MVITLFTEDYFSVIILFFRTMSGFNKETIILKLLNIEYSSLLFKHVTCNIEHR